MTMPRAGEQTDPPLPPDRLRPRRSGDSSPHTYAVSATGRLAGLAAALHAAARRHDR